MKKILIISGVLLVLLVGGLMAFFLTTGGIPANTDEVFARFGQGGAAPSFEEEEALEEEYGFAEDPAPTNSRARLRQLTTKPVAGATIIAGIARFVERGTGHVYEIDVRGGVERLISGTTLARTIRALFSPSGEEVALMNEVDGHIVTTLGAFASGTGSGLSLTELPEGAIEPGFSRDSKTFYFFIPEDTGGRGYEYDQTKDTTKLLFRTSLRDIRLLWGSPTYLYTTPSGKQGGYLYEVGSDGLLSYVANGGRGLMAMRHASGTVVSTITEDGRIVTRDTKAGIIPLVSLFTEKCAVAGVWSRYLVCGSPVVLPDGYTYPDDWFKGVVGLSDAIVHIDSSTLTTLVLSNLEEESGRPLDVLSLGTDATGKYIYFINKYDNALWLLEL